MIKPIIHSAILLIALSSISIQADNQPISSPQAGSRSYLQNYKDMVLAECVATAYKNDSTAAMDAGSSVSALRDWSYYDAEQSIDKVAPLIDSYLKRDYKNPLVESEIKNVQFDFLKCLDLYHSDDLDKLAKKVVINPKHTYRKDHAKAAK